MACFQKVCSGISSEDMQFVQLYVKRHKAKNNPLKHLFISAVGMQNIFENYSS